MRAICYELSRIAWLRAPTFVAIDGDYWTVSSDQRVLIAVRGRQKFGVDLNCESDRELAVRHLRPFLRPEYRGTRTTTLDELRQWCRTATYLSSKDESDQFQSNVGMIGGCYFDRDLIFLALLALDSQSPVRMTTSAVSSAMRIAGRDFVIYVMPLLECPEDVQLCPPYVAA